MSKNISVESKVIHQVHFDVSVPAFTKKELREFIASISKDFDEQGRWIMEQLIDSGGVPPEFRVSFRSPAEFGMSDKYYTRAQDFNSSLNGKTLEPMEVIALSCAIGQIRQTLLGLHLYASYGAAFHVVSLTEDVGKYKIALHLGFISQPTVTIEHRSPGSIYFNPTSHYGVKV